MLWSQLLILHSDSLKIISRVEHKNSCGDKMAAELRKTHSLSNFAVFYPIDL